MKTFIVSLITNTPIVLGQWLTLDAILDGVLENEGIAPEDRVVPIAAWDGETRHMGMSTRTLRETGAIHMASAMRVRGHMAPIDEESGEVVQFTRPQTYEIILRGGHNPVREFTNVDRFPFVREARRVKGRINPNAPEKEEQKFDIKRGPGASSLTTRTCLAPTRVEWLVTGDEDGVLAILSRTPGIGAKIAQGFGRFDPGTIETKAVADTGTVGLFDESGEVLVRPVPLALFATPNRPPGNLAMQTCRSPYWDRSGVVPALVPIARHHDGLLTL